MTNLVETVAPAIGALLPELEARGVPYAVAAWLGRESEAA